MGLLLTSALKGHTEKISLLTQRNVLPFFIVCY